MFLKDVQILWNSVNMLYIYIMDIRLCTASVKGSNEAEYLKLLNKEKR